MKGRAFLGVVLGGLYGLLLRFICGGEMSGDYYSLFSITFIWVLPIAIGIIPILFVLKEDRRTRSKYIVLPALSVLAFFLFTYVTRLEDILCILILALPFLGAALLLGFVIFIIIGERVEKHFSNKKMYSLLLLPLILNPLEGMIKSPVSNYHAEAEIKINGSKEDVWNYLLEVPFIAESEYEHGIYNAIGVPRPVSSKLETSNNGMIRVGNFTDDLRLVEEVSYVDSFKQVDFKILMEQCSFRDLPMDKHIIKSKYFEFGTISYKIVPLRNGHVALRLGCDYTIQTKVNGYANFWAKSVILDFEEKLLAVIRNKVEE